MDEMLDAFAEYFSDRLNFVKTTAGVNDARLLSDKRELALWFIHDMIHEFVEGGN